MRIVHREQIIFNESRTDYTLYCYGTSYLLKTVTCEGQYEQEVLEVLSQANAQAWLNGTEDDERQCS
ncbi:hypothetical protein M2323_002715 [Rhodoblastus acidophilus]|nr:hypothetical protein [Rhodoblastus acidophilus]MCW2333779.1 hypothetical protein [Rhodoblastus acidophilus]